MLALAEDKITGEEEFTELRDWLLPTSFLWVLKSPHVTVKWG